jgi:uncharacterized membrane protein YkoI
MKLRDFLVIGAITGFAACSEPYKATDTSVVVAPDGTVTSFNNQYPNASNVVWTRYDAAVVPIDWELAGWSAMDNNDYLVRFDMDNENYYAWYDDSGNWVGTAYVVKDVKSLPEAVSKAVYDKYSGYTISTVNREFQKDRMVYEIEAKNANNSRVKLLVDGNGNIIKEKVKS